MIKNLGLPCTIYIDINDKFTPSKGDVFVSNGGTGYEIIAYRKVNSRIHQNRWKINCLRVDPSEIKASKIYFTWHKR